MKQKAANELDGIQRYPLLLIVGDAERGQIKTVNLFARCR